MALGPSRSSELTWHTNPAPYLTTPQLWAFWSSGVWFTLLFAILVPWTPVPALTAPNPASSDQQTVLLTCRVTEQAGATDRAWKRQRQLNPKALKLTGKMGRAEVKCFSVLQCYPLRSSFAYSQGAFCFTHSATKTPTLCSPTRSCLTSYPSPLTEGRVEISHSGFVTMRLWVPRASGPKHYIWGPTTIPLAGLSPFPGDLLTFC